MEIVVIGSGIGGVTFAEEFHKLSPDDDITVVTHESAGYYSRPLLSHSFTRDDIETRIVMRSFDDLEKSGLRVISGTEATSIDRNDRRVTLERAGEIGALSYDRLVLAQGSAALIPPPFRPYSTLFKVLNSYVDMVDLRRTRAAIKAGGTQPHWAIVGGGLIGCEVASDMATAGDAVTLFHALPRLMERQLMEDDSAALLQLLTDNQHVDVKLNANVEGFSGEPGNLTVQAGSAAYSGFHGIIVACGFKPRIDLAKAAGLTTTRGICVDAMMTTDDKAIFAVGDVAECMDGRIYAYVSPVRSQALWLAQFLAGKTVEPWVVPTFKPKAKVHGFTAEHPYLF